MLTEPGTKLQVSQPGDALETEAERMAGRALRAPAGARAASATAERARPAASPDGRTGAALPAALRQEMESRFGHDFTDVRVHTDAAAARLSRDLNAKSFTLREDIYFNAGRFAPESTTGRQLLAHELAHVVQHRRVAPGAGIMLAREPEGAAQPAAAAKPADFREPLLSGTIKQADDYGLYDLAPNFRFKNALLQAAFEYVQTKYGLTVDTPAPEEKKDKKQAQGDSPGKDPDDVPKWVMKLTQKLIDTAPNAPGLDPYHPNAPKGPYAGATWNEDSTLAQRVTEAFYYGWHARHRLTPAAKAAGAAAADPAAGAAASPAPAGTPANAQADVPGNVAELFAHIGASKTNKRAQIIGETPQAIYGWCGPASQFALVISLMRSGYRFKTGKPPLEAKKQKPAQIPQMPDKDPEPYPGYNKRAAELRQMQADQNAKTDKYNEWAEADAVRNEIAKQGAYFLATWSMAGLDKFGRKKDKTAPDRIIGGDAAHEAHLEPGDYLTVIMANSPLSGHVATVIKEEPVEHKTPPEPGDVISRIYFVSGNARNSAVRVEVVQRELPPGNYDWGKIAGIGNRFTELKQAEKDAMSKLNKAAGGGDIMAKLLQKLGSDKEMRARAAKAAPSGYILFIQNNWGQPEKILPFFEIAGMSTAGYLAALSTPAKAELEKATTAKEEYKEKYRKEGLPVDSHDPTYHTMNRNTDPTAQRADGKPVGRVKPLADDHAWVVSIVRSSLLDTKHLDSEVAKAEAAAKQEEATGGAQSAADAGTKVLDKQGLEKLSPEWQALFDKAMAFWEPRGGFQ